MNARDCHAALYPELEGLDFRGIEAYMREKKWTWFPYNRPPTALQIEEEAQRLVQACREDQEWRSQRGKKKRGPRYKSVAAGGLFVILYEDGSSVVSFGEMGRKEPLFEVRR